MPKKEIELDNRDGLRIKTKDKEFIIEAAKKAKLHNMGISKNDMYVTGALKEAKKILRDIEKGK